MRILVAHHHLALVGGIETYLAAVMPRLVDAGHKILFTHEQPAAPGYDLIPFPSGVEAVSIENNVPMALTTIRQWQPDLAFVHALHIPQLQRAIVEEFPTVLFAHGYYGLCISGSKTWKRVPARPCGKRFDWKCLLYFHAKSCGGSNPITMFRDYLLHARQLATLRKCSVILTHGGQMQSEYISHGIPAERVLTLPHFVQRPIASTQTHQQKDRAKLLYVGRFDELKGGALLIRALPGIAEKLRRPIQLTMVGTGPASGDWKWMAENVSSKTIRVEFPGWASRAAKDQMIVENDLLVVPSVWPEPFGQVGLEAASLGMPAVAFNVGGIPLWLREGINGHLAPADPPTAGGLTDAIVKALGNLEHYVKLRAGALQVANEFSAEAHLSALIQVFEGVAGQR